MTNQFSVDKVLHSVTLGVFYKSIFWKSAFIGFCPKVQYNLSRNRTIEAMDLSFLLQLSVGYIFGL